MSEYDWLDSSIGEVERSVDSFHESFKEFTAKCDALVEHMTKTDFNKKAIKDMVREAQIEALEEILSRFTDKEMKLKNLNPEVAEMMKGFRGVIEVWKEKDDRVSEQS